ncbi:hypothetical protein UT300013_35440 [Paraclostridium sordellii]
MKLKKVKGFITMNREELKHIELETMSINIHMKDRIYRIVQLAKNIDTDILILGAFGCGVFKNDSVFTSSNFERVINRIILRDSMTIKFAIVGKVPRGFY